ncbi:Phosphatidylinositol-3-phosphatase [Giardia duodenalis]|uniref:Phosphatidylinositol-3-phosphatase n=1 Tax=Giardia intestinalis TaxID=5741 RepID=V6T8H5_GIAIN|nr:Phosphatidylinositol-3-phosphatase [Giardia intestinalis]
MVLLDGEFIVFQPFLAATSIPSYTEGNLWLDPSEYATATTNLPPSNGHLLVAGQLYLNIVLTNYRMLLFRAISPTEFTPFASIPHFMVVSISKIGGKKSRDAYGVLISLITPLQFAVFLPRHNKQRTIFIGTLLKYASPRLTLTHLFPCFSLFTSPKAEKGWFIYDPFAEYCRQGVGTPRLDLEKFMKPFDLSVVKRPLGTLGIKASDVKDGMYRIVTGNPKLMVCIHEYEEMRKEKERAPPCNPGHVPFWSLTDANFDYSVCNTYPFLLAVPSRYSGEKNLDALQLVAGNRSHRRLPVLAWKDKDDRYGVILRSSQPYNPTKKSDSKFVADRAYLQHIWQHYGALHKKEKLLVIDARTRANMQMNQFVGRGTEGYPFVHVEFLDIPGCQYIQQRHIADCALFASTQDNFQYHRLGRVGGITEVLGVDPRNYILQDTEWMKVDEVQTTRSQQDFVADNQPPAELVSRDRIREDGVDHESSECDISGVEQLSPSIDFNTIAVPQYVGNENVDHSCQAGSSVVMIRTKWTSTRQLEEVHRLVIAGAVSICENIIRGTVVLVHCSDGWDRTAQLVALAMLMLDPYYRSMNGFFVLIEKEWCSFGHRFSSRCGILQVSNQDQESLEDADRGDLSSSLCSPVFLQFLELVYYLLSAYPSEFEFTEEVLKYLAYHTYSARFGTFIGDCELDRLLCQLPIRTASIWDHLLACKDHYTNKGYSPESILKKNGWVYLKLNCNRQLPAWPGYWEQHIPKP